MTGFASPPFGAGLGAGMIDDPELAFAGARAHNRWLAEFCAEQPKKRAGIGLIHLNDVDDVYLRDPTVTFFASDEERDEARAKVAERRVHRSDAGIVRGHDVGHVLGTDRQAPPCEGVTVHEGGR